METPKTLQQAIIYFADPDRCQDFMIAMRWPDGNVNCPRCGSENIAYLEKARLYKCYNKHPRAKFSLKVGTIFEDSPIGLDKWLTAMWLIVNAKNGISSYEIHRAIGITQKSAWFVLHRIRLAMQGSSFEKLSGEVEVDETYVGGAAKNMHIKKRKEIVSGSRRHRTAVMGIMQRRGNVKAKVIVRADTPTLLGEIEENVEVGSIVFTDDHGGYRNMDPEAYVHEIINHAVSYVRGNIHTNSIENFWSLLKRTIKGTYVSVAPEHLQAYVEEQAFRFNERKGNDSQRFLEVVTMIVGKRLEYKRLIGMPSC